LIVSGDTSARHVLDGWRRMSCHAGAPSRKELAAGLRQPRGDATRQGPHGHRFMLPPALSLAAAPTAFGLMGAGGSLGFADPEAELAFGYVMNQMQPGTTGDPRSRALVEAVYASP